jgi:hypothetical protein
MGKYKKVKIIARYLGIPLWRVYGWINSGKIGWSNLGVNGPRYGISKKDVEDFEASNYTPAKQKAKI